MEAVFDEEGYHPLGDIKMTNEQKSRSKSDNNRDEFVKMKVTDFNKKVNDGESFQSSRSHR